MVCDKTKVEWGWLYADDQLVGGVSKVLACQKPMTFAEENIHSRGSVSGYFNAIFSILSLVCYP